jgi:hypothetical protein
MPRKVIVAGIIIALLLPFMLLVIRHPAISTRISDMFPFSKKTVVSDRYSVQSEVPGYTLTRSDTMYLDPVTANQGAYSIIRQ